MISANRTPASNACPSCNSANAVRTFTTIHKGKTWHLANCLHCAQQYTDPLPTLDDIKTFYSDDYHTNLQSAESTEAAFGPKFRSYVDWICTFVKGGRSLDLGCTTGLLPYLLKQRGFEAEGLEINSVTAAWGAKQYDIPIRNEPFETAHYEEKSFALVSMGDVLEHSLDPAVSIARVHSILKDRGFAFISFPDIKSIESSYFKALALATRRSWLWSSGHVPLHTWEFTRPTAEALFNRSGFDVIGFRRSHANSYIRSSLRLAVLTSPPRILGIPFLGNKLGTQMEFVLRKKTETPLLDG
jgi:2-polyprenyl-3-methyl-5-hydroxy-6-metoxy-1,4-benzoquinol methylase